MSELIVGVGQSLQKDSFKAGTEAAAEAVKKLAGPPDVLLVFSSPVYDHKPLLGGIHSVCGDVAMVGGTTAGEISTGGFSDQSVVLAALRSDSLRFVTGIGRGMSGNEEACSAALLENLKQQEPLDDVLSLLLFPDGMGGDGVKVLNGIYGALGEDTDIEIVGGYLGDEDRFEVTYQYYNGDVCRDAITGLMICGKQDFHTAIGVRSGFESIGNRMFCTDSEGNVVKEFDNERALDLYKEMLGEDRVKRLPGVCLEYPFGLIDDKVSVDGEEYFQLRAGLSVDPEKGTITLAGSIPEGSAITLTTASRGDIIDGARQAANKVKENLGDRKPEMILMFSCVGRRKVLGRRTGEEVTAVKEVLGDEVPILGFYTYGEFGPIDKMRKELSAAKFHNETLVIWALGGE